MNNIQKITIYECKVNEWIILKENIFFYFLSIEFVVKWFILDHPVILWSTCRYCDNEISSSMTFTSVLREIYLEYKSYNYSSNGLTSKYRGFRGTITHVEIPGWFVLITLYYITVLSIIMEAIFYFSPIFTVIRLKCCWVIFMMLLIT